MPDHVTPSRVRSLLNLRVGLIVLGGLVVLAGGAYLTLFAIVGSGVLPNTKVGNVAIGMMSRSAAQTKVAAALDERATAKMVVTAAGQPLSIDPASAGLTVDVKATVAAGGRRHATPAGLWRDLFAHHSLEPVLAVDGAKLDAAVTALDGKIVGGGHDGGIKFNGTTPIAIPPVQGIALVHDKAVAAIRAAYFTTSAPVTMPVKSVQPSVTADEVQRVLTTIAQPAVAAPIALVVGPTTLQVKPAVIAQNLSFSSVGGHLVPAVNSDGIVASLGANAFSALETPSKNASFDVSSGAPVIVPSVEGGTADVAAVGPGITAVLTLPAPRNVNVPSRGIEPTFSTTDAEKLGVKEQVSTFTTHHPCCAARVHNIHTIADIVNGAVIMPGATFSLNQFVGPRDTKRGFVEAPMIEDGLFQNSVGGGVSQFATTMFNAVFFAGLKDLEHHPHSYFISRYPAGREATVSFPNPNLVFQNDQPTAIVVTTAYTGTSLTVTFWGTKYYDIASATSARYAPTTTGTVYNPRPDCEPASGEGGFQIDVTQTFLQAGVSVRTHLLHTRYDPEPIIICGPSPSPGSLPPGGTPPPGVPTPAPTVTPSPTATKPTH